MDYYNDFQSIVRSDDISAVIDANRIRSGRSTKTESQLADEAGVLGVFDALKLCTRSSYPAVIRLSAIIASLTVAQLSLFLHVLGGGTFTQYADMEGTTRQAVCQQWHRMSAKNPAIRNMRRRKHDARRVLEEGARGCA